MEHDGGESTNQLEHYALLAEILGPPGAEFPEDVAHAGAALGSRHPDAAESLAAFGRLLPGGDEAARRAALHELFVRTFEVQAVTTLDVGYTLFGEDYKRGALLANLSREHQQAGNDCGTELADFLPNVLRLLPKMTDTALRAELVRVIVAPALREMIREFEPARIAKKEELYKKHYKTIIDHAEGETRTAYRWVLQAVYSVLKRDFGIKTSLPVEGTVGFDRSIAMEMRVEDNGPCATNSAGL